ncbi:hypothetical protein JCM3770_000511 [Rhodotorula araucariae]
MLFRRSARATLERGTKVTLHPILKQTDCVQGHGRRSADFYIHSDDLDMNSSSPMPRLNGYDYPAERNFVTSPASEVLRIRMREDLQSVVVKNRVGVTVRQALQAIAAFWTQGVHRGRRAGAVRYPRLDGCDWDLTMRHTFGNHTWLEGWCAPRVRSDGSIYLQAHQFGS